MARTLKEPEIRRKEIVDVAQKLFEENGYENTAVETIINTADIAKGTFYYYFKSKMDLLDEIVKQNSNTIHSRIEEISKSESLSTIEKLIEIFTGKEKKLITNSKVMEVIHKPENRELQEKLNISYMEEIVPLITDVFNQGYSEKLWTKEISVQCMQIILGGAQFMLDSGLFALDNKQKERFLAEIEDLLEFAIGAQPKTLKTIFNNL